MLATIARRPGSTWLVPATPPVAAHLGGLKDEPELPVGFVEADRPGDAVRIVVWVRDHASQDAL